MTCHHCGCQLVPATGGHWARANGGRVSRLNCPTAKDHMHSPAVQVPRPPCLVCEYSVVTDDIGRFVRYDLEVACPPHFAERKRLAVRRLIAPRNAKIYIEGEPKVKGLRMSEADALNTLRLNGFTRSHVEKRTIHNNGRGETLRTVYVDRAQGRTAVLVVRYEP